MSDDRASDVGGAAPPDRTALAGTRTVLAAERTLMAWIRTALSMISFGFTIYKFFHALAETATIHPHHASGPRTLGLVLVALGTVSLVAGIVQYVQIMRATGDRHPRMGFSFYVAMAVVILGLTVFGGVALSVGPF